MCLEVIMRLNSKAVNNVRTFEGAPAFKLGVDKELRRAVMSCLLWESQYYENGVDIATRIKSLVPMVDPQTVAQLALEARSVMNLRHVPLLLATEMLKYQNSKPFVAELLSLVIQRPDELTEALAIYWSTRKEGETKRPPLAAQLKKGLALAFGKFNEYQLGKYNRPDAIKLRDVLRLVHPKPKDSDQAALWKSLVEGTIKTPDTWEVALSAGADKKATFERLMTEGKLGGLALLRNLRNMINAGVDSSIIKAAIKGMNTSRILPFRFIAAARFAPNLNDELSTKLVEAANQLPKLKGKTVVLVDVSGSMDAAMSSKSDMTRIDAAAGVAAILRECCDDVIVATFSQSLVGVPNYHGLALVEAIKRSQVHSSTYLGEAIDMISVKESNIKRLVVITDEQSHDNVNAIPNAKCSMINVASYKNAVGYGSWLRIDGFSESVVRYLIEMEKEGFIG